MSTRSPAPIHAVVSACLALLALSTPAQAGTFWLCNLSADSVHLICLADVDLRDESVDVSVAATTTARVRGTRFPLNPRFVFTVDMWSPPSEPERLEQLAQSTICYRSPGCRVSMAPIAWTMSGISRVRSSIQR